MAAWLHVRFDGEGLATAKLTRHVKGSQVWMIVDDLQETDGGRVFPVTCLIDGVGRFPMWMVTRGLKNQYPDTQTISAEPKEGRWVGRIMMPEKRLWSSTLKFIRPWLHQTEKIRVGVKDGWVDLYAEVAAGVDAKQLQFHVEGALASANTGGDVVQLASFEESPWEVVGQYRTAPPS